MAVRRRRDVFPIVPYNIRHLLFDKVSVLVRSIRRAIFVCNNGITVFMWRHASFSVVFARAMSLAEIDAVAVNLCAFAGTEILQVKTVAFEDVASAMMHELVIFLLSEEGVSAEVANDAEILRYAVFVDEPVVSILSVGK